jgi:hypothetical protein
MVFEAAIDGQADALVANKYTVDRTPHFSLGSVLN